MHHSDLAITMQAAITTIIILDALLVVAAYFIPLGKLSEFEITILVGWLGLHIFCVVGFSLICFAFYVWL